MMSFGVKSVNGWVIGVGGSNAGLSGKLLRIAPMRASHCIGLCRTDALSKTIKNEGQKPRWSQQDAYILVHKCVYYFSLILRVHKLN